MKNTVFVFPVILKLLKYWTRFGNTNITRYGTFLITTFYSSKYSTLMLHRNFYISLKYSSHIKNFSLECEFSRLRKINISLISSFLFCTSVRKLLWRCYLVTYITKESVSV